MNAYLEKLRNKCGSIRRSLSYLVRQVEELCAAANVDEKRKIQLRTLESELLEKKEHIKELDKEILDHFYEKDEDDEVIDKEKMEASEFAQKVTIASFKVEDFLGKFNAKTLQSPASRTEFNSSPMCQIKVKLPKLKLR